MVLFDLGHFATRLHPRIECIIAALLNSRWPLVLYLLRTLGHMRIVSHGLGNITSIAASVAYDLLRR